MPVINDVGPDLPTYPPVPTGPQGQVANTVTSAPPTPTPANAWDYAKNAAQVGIVGSAALPAVKAIASGIAPAAWRAAALVSRLPTGLLSGAKTGLMGLAAVPAGRAIGGAAAGVQQSLINPNSPAQVDYRQDIAAQEAATNPLNKAGLAAYALAHAGLNTLKTAGQGVQLAFGDDGAPAAAAPVASTAAAAVGDPKHAAAPYMHMDPDSFAQHVAGLNRRDAMALMQIMPSLPKMDPHMQAVHQLNTLATQKYQSAMAQAEKETDPKKKLAAQQLAAAGLHTDISAATVAGAAPYTSQTYAIPTE